MTQMIVCRLLNLAELTLAEQEAVVQQVWAYAQDWYTQQLATVQHDLRTSIERDVESIKGCIESYREQIARLTCQKRMLLQQASGGAVVSVARAGDCSGSPLGSMMESV